MKSENKKLIKSLVVGIAILVFGILFCVSQGAAMEALSYVLGIVFILGGLAFVVTSIVEYKRFATNDGFTGAFLLAFGILFMVDKLGWVILSFIPFTLMCIGALLIFDSIILISKKNKIGFGVYLALGAIALTVGILLKVSADFNKYASLVFGIILIVYAVLVFASAFIDFSKAKSKKKDDVVIDVKPTDVEANSDLAEETKVEETPAEEVAEASEEKETKEENETNE